MRTILLIASGGLDRAATLPYIVATMWDRTLAGILHGIARACGPTVQPAARPAEYAPAHRAVGNLDCGTGGRDCAVRR